MYSRKWAALIILILLAASCAGREREGRPRLFLLIVVDQFRADYLERFQEFYGTHGFRRLLRDGAVWRNAHLDYFPTLTAPSHASLLSGAWPAVHGIVNNEWFDRDTNREMSAVSDQTVEQVGGRSVSGFSPRRMLVDTIGDELRRSNNLRSKVIGVSIKPRSAILTAGKRASAAYWYDEKSGEMVSSNYYMKSLPVWVQEFNRLKYADQFRESKWERLLPADVYEKYAGRDSPLWEVIERGEDTNSFPHAMDRATIKKENDFYGQLRYTPFANDLLLNFTEKLIHEEKLGVDEYTDILILSFSANDYIGHRFGPNSHEAMDITIRTDKVIATLLERVTKQVEQKDLVVAFTSDHGVTQMPEQTQSEKKSGGRIHPTLVEQTVDNALTSHMKSGARIRGAIQYLKGMNLYFNRKLLSDLNINAYVAEQVACEAIEKIGGVARCYTRARVNRVSGGDLIDRRVQNGFMENRNGDLIIVLKPDYYLTSTPSATHGSPYNNDTHVPLILVGERVRPGRYNNPASPIDIVPTISKLLGLTSPRTSSGRLLIEAIKE
jgi:predicted AlkP superfamily pyrophosphatase or phosphodiesterase